VAGCLSDAGDQLIVHSGCLAVWLGAMVICGISHVDVHGGVMHFLHRACMHACV
jgi:hypothetical protein